MAHLAHPAKPALFWDSKLYLLRSYNNLAEPYFTQVTQQTHLLYINVRVCYSIWVKWGSKIIVQAKQVQFEIPK